MGSLPSLSGHGRSAFGADQLGPDAVPVFSTQIPEVILRSYVNPSSSQRRAGSTDASNDLVGVLVFDAQGCCNLTAALWWMLGDGHA